MKDIFRKLSPYLFFFVTSGFLVVSWFRFGYIYGGGDVGLQVYNPQRIFEIEKYIWWEATGPGMPTPQGLVGMPFNMLFSLLQLIGFNALALQAILFFLILIFMSLGMYFLILFIFGTSYRKYAFLGSLFYLFNPYMMIQVWHRFVHSTFFVVAGLPFMVIFWLKWIRGGSVLNLILFLSINFFALYGFGTIAYILTLWVLLSLITIPEVIFPWMGIKNARRILFLFVLGLFFWILTNIWWLLPILKIAPGFLSQQHSNEESVATLVTLGQQTAVPYLIQMINPFYLFLQEDFGNSYGLVSIRLIPWIFVVVTLTGLIKGLSDHKSARWSIIFPLIFILAKGSASPLGYIYVFLLKNIFPLGVLRNPFEKMGILLPLIYTILFTYGLKIIFDYLKMKLSIGIARIVIFAGFSLVIFFCWPMFTGQIFGKIDKPSFVKVPDDYMKTDEWIKKDNLSYSGSLGKILHFPLTPGESITYNWEHGYSGLEPSALFFTSAPSISHGFNLKQIDDSMKAIYKSVHDSGGNSAVVLRLLQDFNVRYIVLHKDVKWQGGEFYDPLQTEEILNRFDFFEVPQKFGNLVVYKISDSYFKGKISLENKFDFVYPGFSYEPWPFKLFDSSLVLGEAQAEGKSGLDNFSETILVAPSKVFSYEEASPSSVLNLIDQLVSNKNYDQLWIRPLTELQSAYKANNEVQSEKVNGWMIDASRKILEISRKYLTENETPEKNELDIYLDKMKKIFSSNSNTIIYYSRNKNVVDILQTHLYMLRIIGSRNITIAPEVNKIAEELKKDLIDKNFISKHYQEGKVPDFLEKKVHKFQIPIDSDYELILPISEGFEKAFNHYQNSNIIIDGEVKLLTGVKRDGVISFGNLFFKSGEHEVVLPQLYSNNLILNNIGSINGENVKILDNSIVRIESGGDKIGYLEASINDVKGGDLYKISYMSKTENGEGVYLRVIQDTDIPNQDNQVSYALNQMVAQKVGSDFQDFGFVISPLRNTTTRASLVFIVSNQGQGSGTQSVLLKNIEVVKLINNSLMLYKDNEQSNEVDVSSSVDFKQKNPSLYDGTISLKSPSFFIFRESYNPGWKLILEKGGIQYMPKTHLIANFYANAWYIENKGDYSFRLEFEPQKIVYFGEIVALISYVGLILFWLVKYHKKS